MTVHPLTRIKTCEVPGLAYYTPAPIPALPEVRATKPAAHTPHSRATEALAVMFGYYSVAD